MHNSGLSFCTALHPSLPPAKRHLVLRVRAHHAAGWNLQGDRAEEIGRHFESAHGAVASVRLFARKWGCTANVTVYTAGGDVFCVKEIVRA